MTGSNASLVLTDVSVTESETANLRHSYNTRYSARSRSQQSSNTSLLAYATPARTRRSNATPHLPKFPVEQAQLSLQRGDPCVVPTVDLVMRRQFSLHGGVCNTPVYGQWERICRYVIMFLAISFVVLICSYFGHSLSESQGSVDCVKKELKKFKRDITDLKEEIQDIRSNRDQTNKKLGIIQSLVTDLKESSDKLSSCKDKFGKSDESDGGLKIPKNIASALDKYYADKTGKTDFALESAGGRIVTIRDTTNYPAGEAVKFFGFPLCPASNGPRTMLQPGSLPGECWAFKGSQGTAVIQLLGKVRISHVSLEHIAKSMSPSGEISTAPKEFSIFGLRSIVDNNPDRLGQFTYKLNSTPIQEFKVTSTKTAYDLIEFKIHSNHGSRDFTCVYRLRVHGQLEGKRI